MESNRPSGWWYAVAGAVFAAGVIVFAVLLISGISGSLNGFQRGVVPGQIELQLDNPGKYTIYYERRSVVNGTIFNGDDTLPAMMVGVTAKSAKDSIPVVSASANENYDIGGYSGVSIATFEIAAPGAYILTARYKDNATSPEVAFAVGQGFGGRLMKTILGGIATLFGSFVLALVIGGITFIKRKRPGSVGAD